MFSTYILIFMGLIIWERVGTYIPMYTTCFNYHVRALASARHVHDNQPPNFAELCHPILSLGERRCRIQPI